MSSSCKAQKDLLVTNVESSAGKQPVEDSVLQKLQSENDLVIASAVENFAWVRSIDYKIIAQNHGEWKAYKYHKNLMRSNAGSPTSLSAVDIDKTAADSILNYLTEKQAWTIKGDAENGPCNGNGNCNINDAASARLWVITKNAALNPSYYAPEFYQDCCPNEQRALFISITKKIAAIVNEASATK